MLEKRVVIDRLLYPCGSEIPIDTDGLLNTNEGILQKYNGLIGLDEFSKLPGAIILAEGGMGKSIVLQQLQSRFPDGKSYLIELGLFAGNPVGLGIEIDSCFEISSLSATTKYAMLIDGLDEAPELAGAVLQKLRKLPANVVVWIASRDIEAIRAIQSGFPMLGAYTLAPLTLNDIRELARRSQVDAEIFVAAVLHSGITAICAKPMGCNLAITVFQENGLVGVRQVDLWQQGINRLCDETPSETRRLITKPAFNLEEVINCCAWMALGLVVSGKVAIWNGEESHCPSNCSSLSDISSSDYPLELIRESLKRGVFSPLGDGRFRFSHITYRDYFASLGFARCIPPAYWSTLLFTSDKSGVLPQRTGVATWLSAQNHGFLEELAGVEPEILLSSVDAIHVIGPTALCIALLDRSDSISYERRHLGHIADNLFRLSNTSVSGVIRDRLTASNASDAEIDFAIEIARACRCVDLSDVLAEKVLDENTTLHERVSAAYAIRELDDHTVKGRLKQLLPLDPKEDTFDQLRGSILQCCWPDHLQVDELFENLTPPQRSNYVGPYEIFLDYELPASFKVCIKENVASKYLQWSLQHITRDQILDRLGRLASFIYTYCWNWALTPDLASLLAIGYLKALKLNTTPFAVSTGSLGIHNDLVMSRDEFMQRIDERFAVLEALLKTTEIDNSTLMHLSINAYPLFGQTMPAQS